MLRHTILGLLIAGPPLHGFALIEAASRLLRRWIGTGEFYVELSQLVRDGLIQPVGSAPNARRRRPRYASTSAGREAFESWLAAPLDPVRYPLALRAALLPSVRTDLAGMLIEEWHQASQWDQQRLEIRLREIGAAADRGELRTAPAHRELALVRNALGHVAADRLLLDDLASSLERPMSGECDAARPDPVSRRSGTLPRGGSRRAGRRRRRCSSGS